MFIKKGDKVVVITGKDKGKVGTVIEAQPKKDRVVVEAGFHVIQEVADGFGRFRGVQLNDDVAHAGFDFDFGQGRGGMALNGQKARAKAQGERQNGDTDALHDCLHKR